MKASGANRELDGLCWPASRLGEAIESLARASGMAHRASVPSTSPSIDDSDAWNDWIDATASAAGLEAEPLDASYAETEALVSKCGPALLQVKNGSQPGFLAVLGGAGKSVSLLTPAFQSQRVLASEVRAALCPEMESMRKAETEAMLERAGVPAERRPAAVAAILRQQLACERVGGCWLLRLPPSAGIWVQALEARLPSRLLALMAAHGIQYSLWLLSWWMIGQAALQGRFDWGWLAAWALVLFSMIPFQLLVTWWQGLLSVRIGALLKRRLLFAALQLQPEEIRHQGTGQLLGRVIESEAVESLALSGGFLALMAGLELALAAVAMAFGPCGAWEVVLLAGWIGVGLALGWRYCRDRDWWTQSRLKLTNDLVEQMVGHRTRLAQELPEHRHEGEDEGVSGLMGLALRMDRSAVWLAALIPRGWLLLGLAALAPSFIWGQASAGQLAVGLGGVLLGFRALQRFADGLSHLAGAAIAWKQVAALFGAADRPPAGAGATALAVSQQNSTEVDGTQLLLEAHNVNFCYHDRGLPVLRQCNLSVRRGDRIILEGPSGGGKSTFASMLAGLRAPDSGLVLWRGLNRQTVGLNRWRRHVVTVPQFHENHVLTATFGFNLFMGGRWPPRASAIQEAEAICRDLGLDELLKRMPAGLLQLVGESGWQLSHGEKSRLYIARALLQKADLVILDESFASLDPENLRRALRCVLARARTLLVIAHP